MPGFWHVGDLIADRYEVREVITTGGMGVVYRVWHRNWRIELAVKTPRPELLSSPARMRDFETEAEAWVDIGTHPHTVACTYVVRIEGVPRVFAEWVEGGSLADAIRSGRLYAGRGHAELLDRVLDLAIQYAWGLEHAHSRGLVHQDVKPANAMLTADWTLKVTDFGLAKARAVAGESTAARGMSVLAGYGGLTPAYCSPEQAQAAHQSTMLRRGPTVPLTRATDVWSWAITVWEMFAGGAPCRFGQTAAEVFDAYLEEPWPNARLKMPSEVALLLGRCLQPDLRTRPKDIGTVAHELILIVGSVSTNTFRRARPLEANLLADGLSNQALSLLDLGKIEQAETKWQQALTADRLHLHAAYNYGLHRWRTGTTTDLQLIDELGAISASHRGDPICDYFLGAVHLERGDNDSAVAALTRAVDAASNDADIARALHFARRPRDFRRDRILTTEAPTSHRNFQALRSVALSADGRIAVTLGDDGRARVWDTAAGRHLGTLNGENDRVSFVALSANGLVAATGGRGGFANGSVRVWDVSSGRDVGDLINQNVGAVALSGDGRLMVSGNEDRTVGVWDVSTGRCLRTLFGHGDRVVDVSVSDDGRIGLSLALNGSLLAWDLASGRRIHAFDEPVARMALSADGRFAVMCSRDGATVRIWDVVGAEYVRTLDDIYRPGAIAIGTDGKTVVWIANRTGNVTMHNLANGEYRYPLRESGRAAHCVASTPDGRVVVCGFTDGTLGVSEEIAPFRAAWSYMRPRSAIELSEADRKIEAAIERAEQCVAAGDWRSAADVIRAARAIPGYRRNSRLVDLWQRVSGAGKRRKLIDVWFERPLTGHAEIVTSVAISVDGSVALSGAADGTVYLWNLSTATRVHVLDGHTARVSALALGANGRIAISASVNDADLRVWNVADGELLRVLPGKTESIPLVALSASRGVALSGGSDSQDIQVWDVESGRRIRTIDAPGGVTSLSLSSDGRIAVACCRGAASIWEIETGHRLRDRIDGNTTRSVALSKDGSVAITTDGLAIRAWDLDTFECQITMSSPDLVRSVAVSADGQVAVSLCDRAVQLWDLTSGHSMRALYGPLAEGVALSGEADVGVCAGRHGAVSVFAIDWHYEFAGAATGSAGPRSSTADRMKSRGHEPTRHSAADTPVRADPVPGSQFAGYTIRRKLGAGSTSGVYLADHPWLTDSVALKVLNFGLVEDTLSRTRFQREVEYAARFYHPHIARVLDCGRENGQPWIAMEYVDGPDVMTALQGGPIPAERAVRIVSDIAEALDYCHDRGALHCDVKPGNILLRSAAGGRPENAFLIDFGIAATLDVTPAFETGVQITTVMYPAPEQLEGTLLDRRADMYALGCTLYQLLTGVRPYTGTSAAAIFSQHLSAPPPKPTETEVGHRLGLSAGFDAVIEKALAKNPDDRFDTCGQLAAAARKVLGRGGQAPTP